MKSKRLICVAAMVLFAPTAKASTTLYVNGVTGSDSDNCESPTTACKTIGHAISLASGGDVVIVAAATYMEHLTIGFSITVIGAGAGTTIIDGGSVNTVVTISSQSAVVTLLNLTIRNGGGQPPAGSGIRNSGTLTIDAVKIIGNRSCFGGGIANLGVLTINKSTISGNSVSQYGICRGFGAGIGNSGGTLTLNNSTISGNSASGAYGPTGGGIYNDATLIINNSTITGNVVTKPELRSFPFIEFGGVATTGGGIANKGTLRISSSTISANQARLGGNLYGPASTQNSIIANSVSGGNCDGTMSSHGYNLSSDGTCNFNAPGDLNNRDPLLGPLQNNGGPTETMALLPGSPAIDGGNPNGCTDGSGHLLTTDQRGMPRPDKEDARGCDIGAFERQTD